ncbi:hypothetical protein Zmor_006876 [Zophobas morio]|uniref:UDP-glucuronosyltransferase n=2 Tax=Zophobas morio TaxID=2755281 RepID=A0AA38IXY9_9CUCU|nr:hypothetical protein Zmor_006876 [Zophobas morio]
MEVKQVLAFFAVMVFLMRPAENARILAIMPTPSYSHQIVFNPLWLALNSRGHHVTLFTTDPIKQSNLSNFRQVDWSFTYELWHNKHNASDIIKNFKSNFLKCLNQYVEMMSDIFIQELEHPQVQEIMNDTNEHFDLVIAEFLNPVMIAFSRIFKCPFIGVSPMDVTNFVHEALNNPISPALFPDFLTEFDNEMTFFERIINTFYYLGNKLYFKYYFYPKMDNIIRKFFGENTPSLEEMQRDVSMVFINTNPILHNIRPLMSNVLMLGGGTHIESNVSLTADVQKFLNDAKTGAIYFSLGTNVKSRDLSAKTQLVFLEAFSELPYKVLWKFENNISTASNVMIKDWLPQQQILGHPNMKLFITQGGLQSLEEAIYNAVPIIAMPVFVDQYSNIRKVIRNGMGLKLDYDNVEKSVLKNAIHEVISNPRYKTAAIKLSAVLKEQPISGITEAVWWTEYVLKYNGAKFLKHSEIPLYQYLMLDLLAFFFLTTILLTFLSYKFIKYVTLLIKRKRIGGKVIKLE